MRSLAALITVTLTCAVASAQEETPSGGGLGALLSSGVEGPIVVMDLVKFKPGGAEKYAIYDGIAEKKLASLGGEVVFRGSSREVSGLDYAKWDRVTFRKYPSMQAVMQMAASSEYQGAFPHRMASVERSIVDVFSGELPSFGGNPSPGSHPMNKLNAPHDEDTVYMLNLLRFKDDGGREQYYGQYGAKTMPMIQIRGGGPVYVLKGVGPVIADEEIDRLILVTYPSPKLFREMIESPEYQAIAHLRTEAIELGLLFPFSYE